MSPDSNPVLPGPVTSEVRHCPTCQRTDSLAAWKLYRWGNARIWEHRCGHQEPGYLSPGAMLPLPAKQTAKEQIGEE